jgi:catechol 2,3-dioxygenase-like lactoylglutathione lyase family enzyme
MLRNAARPPASQMVYAVLVLLLVRTAGAQTVAPQGLVSGVGNFSHIVASLDRSVEFYRDVIGLAVDGPPRVFAGDTAQPRFQDPGAANLILTVRDIDAIVARAKKAGFFVELFQPSRLPATTAPASSNVIGGGFEIMVADTDRTMRLY